jgi:colanic acid/amylovoran biosynthesis protein
MKLLLIGATLGADNRGVGALAAGALSVLATDFPERRISFLDYGTAATVMTAEVAHRSISVPIINLRFSWKVGSPNNIVRLLITALACKALDERRRKRVVEGNSWLKAIDESDAALALSGGDSFSDIYGVERFFYVWLPQLLVLLLDKKLILLPQTIGPFRRGLFRALARFIMRRATVIYARDRQSESEARSLLALTDADPKIKLSHDLGFLCEPHAPEAIDLGSSRPLGTSGRPVVGVNVSGLLMIGGYARDNSFGLSFDYRRLVERIVRIMVESKGCDVLLVPHVFGSDAENDAAAAAMLYDALSPEYDDRLLCLRGTYDQSEIKYVIGRCDFFIGSRMHACIAALSQCVPAVAVAYSRKFVGVLETIESEHLVADATRMTVEEVIALVDRAFDDRARIRASLQRAMPSVRESLRAISFDLLPTQAVTTA